MAWYEIIYLIGAIVALLATIVSLFHPARKWWKHSKQWCWVGRHTTPVRAYRKATAAETRDSKLKQIPVGYRCPRCKESISSAC